MPTRVYIQSEHFIDIKLIEINDDAPIEELKRAALALLPPGTDATELALSVEDDDDDAHAGATHVKHLKKEHGIRVHLHRCKQVEVQVRFGAEVVHHKFRPATTVGRVRLWAVRSSACRRSTSPSTSCRLLARPSSPTSTSTSAR